MKSFYEGLKNIPTIFSGSSENSTPAILTFNGHEKNCFANLSLSSAPLPRAEQDILLKISAGPKTFWLATRSNLNSTLYQHWRDNILYISISKTFASALDIAALEGNAVKVESGLQLRQCRELGLVSNSFLESHLHDLEDHLRLQIAVVWKGLSFPYFYKGYAYTLTVDRVNEGLDENTPVQLAYNTKIFLVNSSGGSVTPSSSGMSMVTYNTFQHQVDLSIRITVVPEARSNIVSLPAEVLAKACPGNSISIFPAKLTRYLSPKDHTKAKENQRLRFLRRKEENSESKDAHQRFMAVLVKVVPETRKTLLISEELQQALQLPPAAHVCLSSLSAQPIAPKEITIQLSSTKPVSLDNILDGFCSELYSMLPDLPQKTYLFSNGTPFPISFYPEAKLRTTPYAGTKPSRGSVQKVLVTLKANSSDSKDHYETFEYFYLNSANMRSVKLNSSTVQPLPKINNTNTLQGLNLDELGAVSELADQMKGAISLLLGLPSLGESLRPQLLAAPRNHLLLTGPPGSGRTSIAVALARHFSGAPHYIAARMISCKPLKGITVGGFNKRLKEALLELLNQRGEAILILDDLDVVAPPPDVQQDHQSLLAIAADLRKAADLIFSLQAPILILVTTSSVENLYPSLTSSDARHLFHRVYSLPVPGMEERKLILQCQIQRKKLEVPDSLVEFLAKETDSYLTLDLSIVLDKASQLSYRDGGHIQECHMKKALASYKPSQRRQQPQNLRPLSWENVGGLSLVKEELKKLLIWPSKYPRLYQECKLRPQSGILLYGPPGTGKTLLAGVVAAQSQLHFISIKGPELLSKYVGASEQAIRDVFMRAQSARPSLLFFDEFDAIAPKRGHDSTGVTDRVVNQFLTQMDGVEALQGVFVLAATSQPELIDPALLRPGRLDQCLYCPLPDMEERAEILLALKGDLSVDETFLKEVVAKLTPGYSGADLQGLLYTAQLEAFHSCHQGSKSNREQDQQQYSSCIYQFHPEDNSLTSVHPENPEFTRAMTLKENYLKNSLARAPMDISSSQQMDTSPSGQQTTAIHIEDQHLLNAIKSTKRSVSETEEKRYTRIWHRISRRDTPSFDAALESKENLKPTAIHG